MAHGVPATSAAEASLINDVQFQHELDALEGAFNASRETDAFDALDEGLGVRPEPPVEEPPSPHRYHLHEQAAAITRPIELEPRVSTAVAIAVLVTCLLAGAAAAVFVQSDPDRAISALRTATR